MKHKFDLTKNGQAIYKELFILLKDDLKPVDNYRLSELAFWMDQFDVLIKESNKNPKGYHLSDNNYQTKNAVSVRLNDVGTRINALSEKFGLTIGDRAKMNAKEEKKPEKKKTALEGLMIANK